MIPDPYSRPRARIVAAAALDELVEAVLELDGAVADLVAELVALAELVLLVLSLTEEFGGLRWAQSAASFAEHTA
jgi:hypothetical protein